MANYPLRFQSRAEKDLAGLPRKDQIHIIKGITALQNNLFGDIKKLKSTHPEYRLRVGDYRILFEIVDSIIIIHRVGHRREIYR
ncbi:type II toxin-antitoxin system RelE family toxin [Thiospirillum jenense]|uniref:Type II toxin-antitoxin system RelE/ParE family toxin n=1 Tax=Thiospirillum jenense TaxID=1653858 RepID=A0A839HJW9_9GAMM|nr:type II toxin-antitoxin system RelE/ParE family toxin [Thiospirillum jenense]MBB1127058.1 type II toxin-antitoxin system RelE/ParE family toxin [Thiospirillum jenense]